MSYQPNILNAGDIVVINGERFRVKYDFNRAKGDKNLLLKFEESAPKEYRADVLEE